MISKMRVLGIITFLFAVSFPAAAWAKTGQQVMYLTSSLIKENNIVKVTWEKQPGVTQYSVEKWEVKGTNWWHYTVNNNTRPGDKKLKIGKAEYEPEVFVHPANPGSSVELYDQNVKPGHTYFYRVNGGIITAVETRATPVIPLTEEDQQKISRRQEDEQSQMEMENRTADALGERRENYERSTDYPERMAADLVMAVPNWLIEVIGLYDPLELVFEVDLEDSFKPRDSPSVQRQDLIWNMYGDKEFKVINDFYVSAEKAIPVFMAAGIAVAGVLLLFNSTSPQSADKARSYILGILFCGLLLKLGPYLLSFFFDVNRAIVKLCHSVVADEIHQSFLHTIYNKETRSLGSALLALLGCLSIGVVNFQFAVRKVFIAILVGILPIALINAIFPGRRNALAVWVREFTAYVFIPACFAVGLSFFIHFLNSNDFWVTLACLLSLPAINSLVRGALGLSDTGMAAGVGSALGMGALFSMGSILSGGGPPVLQGVQSAVVSGAGGGAALGKRVPGITAVLGRGAVNLGVAGTTALAGSMITGAATGDSGPGLEQGARFGLTAASNLNSTASSVSGFISEVRQRGLGGVAGVADRAMLMDPGISASLANRVLGDNAIGNTAAAVAASGSRAARAVSPLVAPDTRERLDQVTGLAEHNPHADLSGEFEKMRQVQHFRRMFSKIQSVRHSGGSGGIYGSTWR